MKTSRQEKSILTVLAYFTVTIISGQKPMLNSLDGSSYLYLVMVTEDSIYGAGAGILIQEINASQFTLMGE